MVVVVAGAEDVVEIVNWDTFDAVVDQVALAE